MNCANNLAFDNHTCCVDPTLDFSRLCHNEGFCGELANNAAT